MSALRLHGSPCIEREGAAPLLLSAREAALLAWLHLEGPTPRAPLAGRLWPGGDEAKARANLRQLLLRLRRAAGEVLVEHGGLLRLAAGVRVLERGGRLLGPLEFDDAPELAEWLDTRRDAERRAQLREGLAQAREALQAGRLDLALAAADAVLLADPAAEEAHRLRMQVFWQRGDRAAAVQAWDDCRLALRQQFGVSPSAATNDLGHRILAEEAAVVAPPSTEALPEALRRPTALFGREAERSRLFAALQAGQGAVVRGPGGIGKSRLMAAAAEALQPGLWVGGRPGDEHVPGAVASRLVNAAIERFDPQLDGQTRADIQRLLPGSSTQTVELRSALEHRRVLASVARTMLACHARGMRLVVVDDLQFADDLSMEAIGVVIGSWLANPPPRAAVPLFGCRPDELREPARRLVAMLEDSGRGLRIELAPLAADVLATLLHELPLPAAFGGQQAALARALHERVGGNPAHWFESLKSIWRDAPARWQPGQPLPLPDSLRAQVRQRLEQLSGEALQLAQLAAVAQRDFTLPLAAMSLARAPLAMAPLFAELEAAQVFERGGFAHDLVAEAVDASVPASLRAPLHRLVAEHLAVTDAPPASVAAHWQAAGEAGAAAQWHLRAGDEARRLWRHAEAAAAYETALGGLDSVRERAACVHAGHGAARAWLWLSRWTEAAAVLDRVEPLARSADERVRLGTVRTTLHYNERDVEASARQARTLADDLPACAALLAPQDINAALRAITVVLPMVYEEGRALVIVDRMAAHLNLGEPATRIEFRLLRGGLLYRSDRPLDALPDLQAAFTEAQQRRELGPLVAGGGELMRALQALGRAHEALAVGEATLAAAIDGGFGPGFEFDLRGQIAMLLFALGRPGAAWDQVDAAEACHERSGRPGSDVMLRSMLRAMAGCIDEAQVLLARHTPVPAQGTQVHGQYLARVESRIAWARFGGSANVSAAHDAPAAPSASAASAALARATAWGAQSLSHKLQCAAAGLAPSLEDAGRWIEAARVSGEAALQRLAHQQRARAWLVNGQQDKAAADARAALALAEAIDPWLDDTARRWVDAAEVLSACGCLEEAQAALDAGEHWLRQGAEGLSDPARREAWLRGHAAHRQLLVRPRA